MIVSIGQEYRPEFNIGSYIVRLINGVVSSQVQVKSLTQDNRSIEYINALYDSGEITEFHRDKLMEHMHKGVVKDTYFIEDPTIDNSLLDVEEMIQFLDAYQIDPPFQSGDTKEQAIQKPYDKG